MNLLKTELSLLYSLNLGRRFKEAENITFQSSPQRLKLAAV